MEFPKISKEKWKAKIETELRGKKSLDDLKYIVGNELNLDVLLQESDRLEHHVKNHPETTSYGIYFEATPDNTLITEALSQGASALYLSGNYTQDWRKFLEGVHTGYIDLIVNDKTSIVREINEDFFNTENTYELINDRILNISECIKSDNLVDTIRSITMSEGNIGVVLNDSFLLNVACLRVMRLIRNDNQVNGKVIAFLSRGDESPEYQLIRFTAQASAAMTGGSDYVLFSVNADCSRDDVSRIIHIANVLLMESKLARYQDPWKGAYVIEHLTNHIIEKVKGGL